MSSDYKALLDSLIQTEGADRFDPVVPI